MKRTLTSFLVAVFFASAAQAIQVGDKQAEITSTMGQPVAARTKADGTQVWRFKNGTTVWLAAGVVQRLEVPTEGNFMSRDGVMVPSEFSNRKEAPLTPLNPAIAGVVQKTAATQLPAVAPSVETHLEVGHLQKWGYGLAVFGLVVIVMSRSEFWRVVFHVSGGWLASWFFVPLISSLVTSLTDSKSKSLWR